MPRTARRKSILLLAAAGLLVLPAAAAPPARPQPDHLLQVLDHPGGAVDRTLNSLALALEHNLQGHKQVAVLDFANLGGQSTVLGQWLAEELLARLQPTGHYELTDRLYARMAVERAGVGPELTRPASLQLLGKSLGVQAVVTGTITDLGPVLRVFARVYDTSRGTVAGVAVAQLPNTPALARLLGHVAPWHNIENTEAVLENGPPLTWATGARASSQYSESSWNALQVTGAPNSETCDDSTTAWASKEADGGTEWLEVSFPRRLTARAIHIRESFNPGAVVKVEALTERGAVTLWQGTDKTSECPGTLVIRPDPPVSLDRLRITLDSKRVAGWNEIDAVGISGDAEAPATNKK